MKLPEDLVDRVISASAILPTLNHSLVVSIDCEVPSSGVRVDEVAKNTLNANSFSPTDILLAMQGLPPCDKLPSSPSTMDNNGDANFRACVWEHVDIE